MATQIGIVNKALTLLGPARISDINDVTDPIAVKYKSLWDDAVNGEFETHAWRFAIKRATLSPTLPAPAFAAKNFFALPQDCKMIVGNASDYGDDFSQIEREGNNILYSGALLNLRYVSNGVAIGDWPAVFADVISAKLADITAEQTTQNSGKVQMAVSRYDKYLRVAKRAQAIERRFDTSDYTPSLYARFGGDSPFYG